jgi:heme exporter protein D
MMGGMMSGMWIWTIAGILLVILVIVVIAKVLQKR